MVQISSRSSRTRECHPITLCHVTCCEESWHRVMCHDRHVRSHRVSLPPVNCFGKRAKKKYWWNFQHYTCQWLSSCLVGCKTSLFLPQCKRWRRTITDEVSASCRQPSVRVWDNHNEVPVSSPSQCSCSSPDPRYPLFPHPQPINTRHMSPSCPPGSMCHLSARNLILSWFIQIYIRTPSFLYTNKK